MIPFIIFICLILPLKLVNAQTQPIQMEFGYIRLANSDSATKQLIEKSQLITSSTATDTSFIQRTQMINQTSKEDNLNRNTSLPFNVTESTSVGGHNATFGNMTSGMNTTHNVTYGHGNQSKNGNLTHSNGNLTLTNRTNGSNGTKVHYNTTYGSLNNTRYSSTGMIYGRNATNVTAETKPNVSSGEKFQFNGNFLYLVMNAIFVIIAVWF